MIKKPWKKQICKYKRIGRYQVILSSESMENKVVKIKVSGAGLPEVNTEYTPSGKRFVIFAVEPNVIVME